MNLFLRSAHFYLKRLLPFWLLAMLLTTALRVFLFVIEWGNVEKSFSGLILPIVVGIFFSSVMFLYEAIPVTLAMTILPRKFQFRRAEWVLLGLFFFIFAGIYYFDVASSYIFWDEFSSRFNFIAVDYLIYTQEVIGNILESYPVIPIFSGIGFIALISVWFFRKNLFLRLPEDKDRSTVTVPLLGRLSFLLCYAALCVLLPFIVKLSWSEVTTNRYNNEITMDGDISFVKAFFQNELEYKVFYQTRDQKIVKETIQREMSTDNTSFSPQADKDNFGFIRHTVKANPTNTEVTTGIIKSEGPGAANVVLVVMESQGAEYLTEFWNNRDGVAEVTPNLSGLTTKGLYFSQVYATGTRTVRGLEAITLAVPPLPGLSIVRRPGNENLQSTGSIFKSRGYDLKFIYGGYGYFDNMSGYFAANGFADIDRTDFSSNEVTFANAWGVCDEDLYTRSLKEMDKTYAEGKPFFDVLLTTSNHRPFTYPDGRIEFPSKVSGRKGAVKYSDYAVGRFLKEASEKPWFNNTIFIFMGDHGAGSAGRSELNPEAHKIALIYYAPGLLNPTRVDTPISQMDVVPTLMGLMGIDYESSFYGQDAFAAPHRARYFLSNYQKLGMWQDGILVILKPKKGVSVYKDGQEMRDLSPYEKQINIAISFYQDASGWSDFLPLPKKK